ncbi:extracellular solute-binding protein [Desulfopila sp. IMCC35008]|uniref:extracellular solute-binding protein n=1 Tax=Desulfopila sp. IMCC35008 TaxID=2653858 RepID=UPI0013D62A44|nr:extracellular solute-binding protein [Desulfopila sp. IMCC35008]
MRIRLSCMVLFLSFLVCNLNAFGAHGLSIDGNLKYPAGFEYFEYTSAKAQKGGDLVLHDIGTFDKLNPFTLKGEAPWGLDLLVFESLAEPSLDEPFSEYGLIAKDIEVAADHLSVIFTINEKARFSNGIPVTVEDVAYSMNTLKGSGVHPLYPYYYKDIQSVEILDNERVRFSFSQKNRELPMIASQIPIFPKDSFEKDDGSLIGSGPYIVSSHERGKYITYKRNESYWAVDHPVRRNMFNFDTITVKFYKDQTISLEAFKAGDFDFMSINIAKQWARDLHGSGFSSGKLIKKFLPHSLNAGMQGFLMNSRREIFKDRRVRQAIGYAFDFEWTNKSLFYDQYTRNNSFFSNSPFAATGLPQGLELAYLTEFKDELPEEVFTKPLQPVTTKGKGGLRSNLRKAKKLLIEAGWKVKDGVLVNDKGEPFSFEIILVSQTFERVMASFVANLNKLGMDVRYRTVDPTLYVERRKTFDFDMIVTTYGQSLSPGNEQRDYWHSSAADTPGSRNFAGIRSKAIDGLIDRVIYATNSEELTAACKALDRALWYGYYLVPNWYTNGHRIVYANKFGQPETLPLYYSASQFLMTWWATK